MIVRYGDDHVHIVVSRVNDVGQMWHARNDRHAAQTSCTKREKAYGMEAAPRRREQVKQPVLVERGCPAQKLIWLPFSEPKSNVKPGKWQRKMHSAPNGTMPVSQTRLQLGTPES